MSEAMTQAPDEAAQSPRPLRLLAQDSEDLQVISAALQDAIAHVGDIRYEPSARRITVLFNRFRWEANDEADGDAAKTKACGERVYAALQFGDVARVRQRGLDSADRGALINCLAMDFQPGEAPGGAVLLHFSHGGDLRVEVDCVDAVLADVSDPWAAVRAPAHADGADVPGDA